MYYLIMRNNQKIVETKFWYLFIPEKSYMKKNMFVIAVILVTAKIVIIPLNY
jgi:hypothetical protein